MQPSLFSNVRTNLSHLPRAISPHLASPASPSSSSSSIRSLSPNGQSPYLRSRSSSPSPRRFASVLAYHATPSSSTGQSRRRATLEDQQSQYQRRSDDEVFGPAKSREPLRHSTSCVGSRASQGRDESPSRIAFKNLEESWKRFELESTTSPPSSTSTVGLPVSRPASPSSSPLSRPPYRELIECASLRETTAGFKEAAALHDGTNATAAIDGHTNKAGDSNSQGDTNSMTEPSSSSLSLSKPLPEGASTESMPSGTSAASSKSAGDLFQQQQQQQQHLEPSHKGHTNAFLATEEARHILDLPSLLGTDPNMIPGVLAMPTPLRASRRLNEEQPASTSLTATESEPIGGQENDNSSPTTKLISELDAKADAAARAMTDRYSARNLNMTETEAHRMVQVMAAEIVALHEQRETTMQKMEQAKQEMMEAARLLRMRAAEAQTSSDGSGNGVMQDTSQSESKRRQSVLAVAGNDALLEDDTRHHDWHGEAKEQGKDEGRRLNTSLYDKDEWRR